MFYPAQTSFIPVTVAIASFIERHGFSGFYPFWYLGSTPVKYLTGPVVSSLLMALHRFLGGFSLFDLSLGLVVVAFLFSALGWGILAWMLSGRRLYGYIVSLLVLLAPWHWISGFALSEVSAQVTQALTPWVLWVFVRSLTARGPVSSFPPASARSRDNSTLNLNSMGSLRAVGSPSRTATPGGVYPERSRRVMFLRKFPSLPFVSNVNCQLLVVSRLLPAAVLFALLLLTNTVASIPAIIGLIIIGVVMDKRWEQGLKKAALVIFLGWFLTLWWYPPHYWWTLFMAPSIGGRSAVGAMISLVNLMRGFVPVILAIIVVAWGIRKKSLLDKFALSWFGVFGLLTLFRFFADPKFWMDWTVWISEVEVGVALLIARNFQFSLLNFQSIFKFKFNNSIKISNFKFQISKLSIFYLPFTIYIVFGWFFAWQNRHFWLPRSDINQSVEFKIAEVLNENVRSGELVFLSGSTAFWLNSFYDISQVRGGIDQVSQDPRWRQATWEIREGATPEGTERVLAALRINYIVVHTQRSQEYYHDFRYPEKFGQITSLKKIYEQEGDVIYKVK